MPFLTLLEGSRGSDEGAVCEVGAAEEGADGHSLLAGKLDVIEAEGSVGG